MSDEELSSSSSSDKTTNSEETEHFNAESCTSVDEYLDALVQEQANLAILEASLFGVENASTSKANNNIVTGWRRLTFLKFKKRFSITQMLSLTLFLWSLVQLALLFIRTSPVMRKAPAPTPFFLNTNGVVQDFYDGNSPPPDLLMSRAEFTIVMLYAPWEHRSKQFRHSFVEVAKAFLHFDSLKFVAVNCHFYRGKCKQMFKLFSFPVIFAYTPYGHPVVFNQVFSSDRLFSWVLHLLIPLQRINSLDELNRIANSFDFLVVGHFRIEVSRRLPRPYHVFLNAAYKNADLRSSVAFAVVLNSTLALNQFGFSDINQIHFYTFYNRKPTEHLASMEINQNVKSQDVMHWVNEVMAKKFSSKSVYELELEDLETAGKSEALYQKLNSSHTTIVLFTSLLGLPYHSQSQIALKSFVKLFHHCTEAEVAKFQAASLNQLFSHTNRKACSLKKEQLSSCCSWFLSTGKCKTYTKHIEEQANFMTPQDESECYGIIMLFSEAIFKQFCCNQKPAIKNLLSNSTDTLGIGGWNRHILCQFIRLIRTRHYELYRELNTSTDDHSGMELDLHQKWLIGAGCRLNISVGFLMMDKRFGRHFMRQWGLPESQLLSDSVALVAREDERIFWMKNAKINEQTLAHFISGYFNKTLIWEPFIQCIDEQIDKDQDVDKFPSSKLKRINLEMFSNEILTLDRTYDAVVFFSGGDWHTPSSSVLHFFHQAQYYFADLDLIKFFIIDVSQNTLPWKFNLHRLPAIVFFPARGGQESYAFHDEFAFTMPNLLGFLLPRCQERLRWLLSFTACKEGCLERNAQKIAQIITRASDDMQMLRRIFRKRQTAMQEIRSIVGAHHLRTLLRRRQLQKALLLHLLGLVRSMQRDENQNAFSLRQKATEAMLANWILRNKFGTRFETS